MTAKLDLISGRDLSRRDVLALGGAGVLSAAMVGRGMAADQSVTLWHGWTGADNTTALHGVIDTFNNEGKGVTVEPTGYDWDTLFSKWVVSSAAGRAPDLVLFHITELPEFASRGVLRPIDDVIVSSGLDLGQVPEAGRLAVTFEGKVYAAPLDVHPLGFYYNVDMVQEAGLDPAAPPKTGDEFLEWAKKLTVKDGSGRVIRYGFELPNTWATARWLWYSLIHQYGGTFLDDKGMAAVDGEASQKALQYLVDLINVHGVANPEVGGNKGEDAFASKQVAMKFIGPWEVNLRMAQKINFMTAQLPVIGEKPAVWANAHCMSISKQANDEKLAANGTFMKWFFDNFAKPATTVGIIPQGKAARESADFTGTEQYKYFKSFVDDLPNVVYEPLIPQYLSVFSFDKPTPLVTNLQAALSGSKSVADALTDMKQGLDAQLAKKG
ncbi:ABC transporter substrate-binding protein [Mesorhizobium muleiense]|uniref:ABC transporter substrate-binding protein n=1 Tax=Mesorhizobium muleiense TaxID=1004279 RepID=UPI001F1B5CDE|nr:ABC transporter substrate-binding protein [Mesorhizobium muleiense]MCF6112149.1 ABC transporter substrate-binding protein [Mesorhizobium muleiense]